MKTKFITIDRRVKIMGHEQEEGNKYAVWDKASFILFIYLFILIILKILATMSSPADYPAGKRIPRGAVLVQSVLLAAFELSSSLKV